MYFLIRLVVSAFSLGLAARIIPGFYVADWTTMFLAAFLLSIVNAVIRPILVLLTFPITILTLGLFLFILNAAMLGLVAWLLPGFAIAGFVPAFLGWLLMAVVGAVLNIRPGRSADAR
ncbi:MAG: phage holin family protein [Fibrobacteria bacterium]